jgi:hypothetical protein
MPENPNFITPDQYQQYTTAWEELIASRNNDLLQEAFRAPNGARLNFLNFSLDQIVALVTAPGVRSIKARFLLVPDAASGPCASLTLFAADTPAKDDTKTLSAYYVPTSTAATTTQTVEPAPGPTTQITYEQAQSWLAAWVNTQDFNTEIFTTDVGPLKGFNFEVSTFQDPLAAAPPYEDKSLFLNLGLVPDPEPTAALVVYIAALNSRTQGSIEGLPTDGGYYDGGQSCPPNH